MDPYDLGGVDSRVAAALEQNVSTRELVRVGSIHHGVISRDIEVRGSA